MVISEIYLTFAGKNEADVKAKAMELVAQLRAGADFGSVAATNSERELNGVRVAPQNKGKVGSFETPQLREDIAVAIKNVKVGGISEPLEVPTVFKSSVLTNAIPVRRLRPSMKIRCGR